MRIIKSIAVNNPCYKAGRTISVNGLMLHSVGCPQPSAEVFANNWNRSTAEVCVHAVLQADGTVYQLLPWNWRAWHCGGSGNNTHISVEMTEPSQIKYSGGATFVCTDVAAAREHVKGCYNAAVELFAELCTTYNLNPLTQICSHAEGYRKGIASNHGDPEHLWNQLGIGYTMDTFRAAVKKKMNGEKAENSTIEAIDRLADLGVINTPEYWYAHHKEVKYLDQLLENAAVVLTTLGTPENDVLEAIDNLASIGIMNTPAYWKENYMKLKYLDKLLKTMGGCATYSQEQFVRDIQFEIGVGVDGIAGPVTLAATPTISSTRNRTHGVVSHIQKYLYVHGYIEVGTADGIAGSKFDQAVRNFQANNGCVIDGEITAGAKTWKKLLSVE